MRLTAPSVPLKLK
ncbi:hypothetical protein Tco_0623761, partial [Tanacetum coccineum]